MEQTQQGYTLMELMIVMAIIGILGAIAIPVYQQHIAKSQASEAFDLLGGLKSTIVVAVAQDPSNFSCAVPPGSATSGKYVASIVANWVPPNCDLKATFSNTGVVASLRGTTVILRFDSSTGFFVTSKAATSFTLPAKYIPAAWK